MSRLAFLTLGLLLTNTAVVAQQSALKTNRLSANDTQEWKAVRERVHRNSEHIMSSMWALTHAYESKEKVDEAMDLLQVFLRASDKNDVRLLRPVGGLDGFFARFLRLTRSDDDDTVAGFSAKALAVAGGELYAPQIAELLSTPDRPETEGDWRPPRTVRGQAAIALSIIQATQFKERIARLLESENEYDLSGTSYALARMKATEYAGQIANLMLRSAFVFRAGDSAIHALVEMGVAAQHKKEIAKGLEELHSTETNEAAAYALAHLRATEYVADIAKSLEHRYRRGDAAKALAIMGAKEYAPKIARLLDDNEAELDQSAALLALGILKAKEYAPQVANLMRTKKKSFVSNFAAQCLVLMDASEYAQEVIEILKVNKTGTYIHAGDLHPLVAREAETLNSEFKATLNRFKRQRSMRRVARGSRQSTHRTKRGDRPGA